MKVYLINLTSLIILFAGLGLLIHCEPNVMFEEALPPDVPSLSKIPMPYQGAWICESDSSIMHVDAHHIVRESHFKIRSAVSKIQEREGCAITAQGMYLPGRSECIPFTYVTPDTVEAVIYDLDTIIDLPNPHQAIKYDKGRLFINMEDKEGLWTTFVATPDKGGLWLELIDVPNNLKTLEDVSDKVRALPQKRKDIDRYAIEPQRVHFERILERGFLRTCDFLSEPNLEF